MKWYHYITTFLVLGLLGVIIINTREVPVNEVQPVSTVVPEETLGVKPVALQILDKTPEQAAEIIASVLSKLDFSGTYTDPEYGITIEIQSITASDGTLEVLVRAWKDGEQFGFGSDGSVEIERIKIHHPPFLTTDGTTNEVFDERLQTTVTVKTLKELPKEALLRDLVHTISLVGKTGTNIIEGKVGNTTDTYYPDASSGSTTVDGVMNEYVGTWQESHDDTSADEVFVSDANWYIWSGPTYDISRYIATFDTSGIGSDEISTATLSLAGYGGLGASADGYDIDIVSSSPASNNNVVAGDYDSLGTTVFASQPMTDFSAADGTYIDFSLDSNGIAEIDGSGITKFGARVSGDVDNTSPSGTNYANHYHADQGSTKRPKLVVVHEAAAPAVGEEHIMWFE